MRLGLGLSGYRAEGGGAPSTPEWLAARLLAPEVAAPASGTIYVSGASAETLPAGNDTTGTGTALAPYATLTKALSVVPAGGDYLILCDGVFAENTLSAGRWILGGLFAQSVVLDSYSGDASKFIITNASGTNGVLDIRSYRAGKIQIRRATLRSSTDNNSVIRSNPLDGSTYASDLGFFDCIIEARTQGGTDNTIYLLGDVGVSGLHFVRCVFKQVIGGNTTNNPILIGSAVTTASIDNQPHSDIGFWACETEGNWDSFSNLLQGIDKFTFVGNTIATVKNHAFLIGKDTTGDTTSKCTDVVVDGNTFTATGANPHGLEIGSNVMASGEPVDGDGVLVRNNSVTSAAQGIVLKGCTNVVVDSCNVSVTESGVAFGSAAYAKAAAGSRFRRSHITLDGTAFGGFAFREDADGVNKSENTELTSCTIVATGANAVALNWAGASGSDGGATSNDNLITLTDGASLGSVRGTSVTTEANLRAVWGTAGLAGDVATNDSRTTVQVSP